MKRIDEIRGRYRSLLRLHEGRGTLPRYGDDVHWLIARVEELSTAIRAINNAQEGELPDLHKGLQHAIEDWGLPALAKLDEEAE